MRRFGAVALIGTLAAGMLIAGVVLQPGTAQADTGWCNLLAYNSGKTVTLSNVQCGAGGKARAYINYYRNDNNPRVYTSYSPWITSGSTSVSRPAGSYASSGGVQRN